MYKLFFKSQKTVKSVLFAIYLRKGNILHGKNQRCNYGTNTMRSSERLLQIPFYGLKTTHIISNVSLHLTDECQSECLNTIFRLHWNLRRKIMEYLKLSFRNRACCIFGTTGNTVCQNTTRQS